ncbi:MAG: LPS assembly lipoprotein LptE [Burkholderiales bacterium]|nr:LPS assembly lipoprotein LptE [Burkholderiales bacterium]
MMKQLFVVALLLGLSGCGFQLRGDVVIPFKDLYIAAPANSPIGADLKKKLAVQTPLAADAGKADGRITISEEARDKIILSLSGAGRVREYQLKLRVAYNVTDGKGAVLIPRTEMNLTRIMSYDDALVLAKAQEELILYRDMENDVVQQILRRVAQVKRG